MLTPYETETARSQGWLLADVFDPRSKKLRPQILPITFKPPFSRAEQATLFVVRRARENDPLALKAVRLIVQGQK